MAVAALLAAALASAQGLPSIRGRVRARGGEPVPRAEIRLRGSEDLPRPGPPHAMADESGLFAADPPSAGSYFVWASAPGYLDGRAGPIEVKGGGTAEEVSIAIFPVGKASLSGTVTDLGGKPLPSVEVEAVSPGYALGSPVGARSDPDGRFRFETLTAGSAEVTFRLRAPGASPEAVVRSTARVSLQAGAEAKRDARLARPDARIEGLVFGPEGDPLPSVRALAAFEPTFTEPFLFAGGGAASGSDGRFRIEGLIAGEYRVQFFGKPPGGGPDRFLGEAAGVRTGGGAIEHRVPASLPVLVEGVCVRADSGRPAIGSEVTLEVAGNLVARDRSDVEGRFSLGGTLSADLPNILRATHLESGFEERFLRASEVRPDGRYPELVFTVARTREGGPRR